MMKYLNYNRIWGCIILFSLASLIYSCSLSRDIASTNLPEIYADIAYDKFETITAKELISNDLRLKIDTTYPGYIRAYDLYDGSFHMRFFFGRTQWKEKSVYTIKYGKIQQGVWYQLKVESFEAPTEKYQRWRITEPSRETKENIIVQKLNRYEL